MAETNEFYIKIGADVDDAMNKLNRLSNQLSQLASTTQRSGNQINNSMDGVSKSISSAFSSMGMALTTAGITAAIIGIGKASLTTAAELEQISVSFRVFTGSVETADKMLAQLKEQALNSPMQFQDITKGAQTLLQYGLNAQQVIPITKMLGDISGGNSDKFQRLSLAFGQVTASGRLMGQEARQMINAGFNPLKAISDSTGQSMATLTQKMHDGQISVQDVAMAFLSATSEGGQFFGMADEQAKTLGGLFNKLSESVTFALSDIGESLKNTFDIAGVVLILTNSIGVLKESFKVFNSEGDKSTVWATMFKGAVVGLTIALDLLVRTFKLLKLGAEEIIGTLGKRLGQVISYTSEKIFASLQNAPGIGGVANGINNYFKNIIEKATSTNSNVKKSKSELEKLRDEYEKILKTFSDDPSKKAGGKQKANRFKESPLDFSKEYDEFLKQFTNHKNKLIEESKDAESEFDNIGLKGARKRLAQLTDDFTKQKAEFKKYGVDATTITKNYLLKVAQLQGEIEAEKYATLMALVKPLPGMGSGMLGRSLSIEQLKQFGAAMQVQLTAVQENAEDLGMRFIDLGKIIPASIKEMTQNVASSFADMFTVLGQGGGAEDAIRSFGAGMLSALGDMFVKIGLGIVMASKAMAAVQTFLTSMFTPAGVTAGLLGGLAMMAIGGLLKGVGSALSKPRNVATSSGGSGQSVAQRSSGSNYSYGGSAYSSQSIRLAIDLTGAITATQTGYQINKSLETTLRVTGRQ